jgi:hypothetical protein
LKGPPRFPAAARARRSGAIRVAGLKPTGRSLSLGNQANTRPKMPEYGLRSSSSASVPALPRRRRSTIANPVPSAQQLTDAPKQTTRRGSGYSITSSARASSVGGTSRPSAFAVLRLMTNATRVDCSTGKSAGFSPLRMRSRNPSIFRRRFPIRLCYPSQHLLRQNPLPRSQFGSRNGRQLYVRRAVDSEGEVLDILVQPLGRTRVGRGVLCGSGRCPFRKSYPDVLVVQPGQDWDGDNDTGPLDPAAFEGSGLSMTHTAEFILHQFLHPSF